MNALQRLDGRKISRVAGLVVHDSLVRVSLVVI